MSVIKQEKRPTPTTPKTFLGLKVGDNLNTLTDKMGLVRDFETYAKNRKMINVDARTFTEFIRDNYTYVAKVNEDYALVVKVSELSRSINVEATPHSSHAEMNFVLNVDYFVLGHDDNGKVFIHYLDSERSKRVRITEVNQSYASLMDKHGGPSVLNYFIKQNPDAFNKYQEFEMEDILDTMNRDDLGFTRLQGDIVFKLVEGHEGYCPACIRPDDICCQAIGASKPYYVSRDGKDRKTMLYKVEPNLSSSIEICEDCISAWNRRGSHPNMTVMGNHKLASDMTDLIKPSLIEIGDSMTFNTTVLPNWSREFDEPGVSWTAVAIPTREESRIAFDTITTEGLEQETKLMTREDAERMGYTFTLTSQMAADNFIEQLKPGRFTVFSEPVNMDTAGRMWSVGQPRMIIATSQQNVILEHKEHKDKSVYIPKDNIGVFTFQRSAPVIDPGLD